MSDLIPFDYGDDRVRVVTLDGEAWFVVVDVCGVLELTNPSMAASAIDDADLSTTEVSSGGQRRRANICNESGLYELIFQSRKPEAKAFRRWITREVIPSIRKTGSYSNVTKLPSRRDLAEWLIEAEDRAQVAEGRVQELEPAAEFAEDLTSREGSWSVDSAAKLLTNDPAIRVGQRRLFQTLHDWGWIFRREGRWTAKQEHINNGRLAHKVYNPQYDENSGQMRDRQPQVRITWKGLREIHLRLNGERPMKLNLGSEVA